MISVLFLVSLAAIGYILRHPRGSKPVPEEPGNPAAEQATTGLLALGRAVDDCGRGLVPASGSELSSPESAGSDGGRAGAVNQPSRL
jgi:hypothetical protein